MLAHNRWLLVVAFAGLAFPLLFRVPFVLAIVPTYGQEDVRLGWVVFAVSLLSWTALEISRQWSRRARSARCEHCGYSLAGTPCPECGRRVGT